MIPPSNQFPVPLVELLNKNTKQLALQKPWGARRVPQRPCPERAHGRSQGLDHTSQDGSVKEENPSRIELHFCTCLAFWQLVQRK